MGEPETGLWRRLSTLFGQLLSFPQALAFFPATTLSAYWIWGEAGLVALCVGFPAAMALGGLTPQPQSPPPPPIKPAGHATRKTLAAHLGLSFGDTTPSGFRTAAFAIHLEGLSDLKDRYGATAADDTLERIDGRLRSCLRDNDHIVRSGRSGFLIGLAPTQRADLEAMLQVAARLQDATREPVIIGATEVYLTSSVGFCLQSRAPSTTGESLLDAAEVAMREARAAGPGAIRAYSSEMKHIQNLRSELSDDLAAALENGEIRPWYQPQISTDTGEVTGFEALARWHHPERGMIPPAEFLPAVDDAGLSERLSDVILFNALSSLRAWDSVGANIPHISVNFSQRELRHPRIAEKINWELDRFGLTPDRLNIEILETVVSDSRDDMVARNIAALSELGCGIDLDDFGTGNSSIAAIRRFAINRIKIDRSFVTRVDRDRKQQDMVAAILTLSERLNIETVAEGVESTGEHAMLAQLGCDVVQGFCIGRPMPYDETLDWLQKHRAKLNAAADLGRRTG